MPEVGLIINHQYDFIPDRSDDRFLFCPVCDPQEFFCPIGRTEVLHEHFARTGHDKLPALEAHGIPEMQALGAVKAVVCKQCGFTAASRIALMNHVRREHKRAPEPAIAVTVVAETPPVPSVATRVKSFLKRLP